MRARAPSVLNPRDPRPSSLWASARGGHRTEPVDAIGGGVATGGPCGAFVAEPRADPGNSRSLVIASARRPPGVRTRLSTRGEPRWLMSLRWTAPALPHGARRQEGDGCEQEPE